MKEDDTLLPWEDVNACMHWWNLLNLFWGKGEPCPFCGKPTKIIWFSSPRDTWDNLCGTAGYLTLCKDCHRQLDYDCWWMN